jgi:hypothetical protein
MNPTAATLPEDVAALRALLLEAWSERDAERAENARHEAIRELSMPAVALLVHDVPFGVGLSEVFEVRSFVKATAIYTARLSG